MGFKGMHEVDLNHKAKWVDWRKNHKRVDPYCQWCNATELVVEYLQDMSEGFVNYHTRSQMSIIFGDPYSRWPDFVGRIEMGAKTWQGMRAKMGLPSSTPPTIMPHANKHSYAQTDLVPKAWKYFCNFY